MKQCAIATRSVYDYADLGCRADTRRLLILDATGDAYRGAEGSGSRQRVPLAFAAQYVLADFRPGHTGITAPPEFHARAHDHDRDP